MFAAIGKFFSALYVLFDAFERGANTLNNGAKWAEEQSGHYLEQSRIENNKDIKALNAEV